MVYYTNIFPLCRSQWPRGLRRRSAAARLLRLWVRIPPRSWMSVCCECCVLSGRGLCDGLITRPEESYRMWCVAACDLETSWMRRPWPTGGFCAKKRKNSYCKNQQNLSFTQYYYKRIREGECYRHGRCGKCRGNVSSLTFTHIGNKQIYDFVNV